MKKCLVVVCFTICCLFFNSFVYAGPCEDHSNVRIYGMLDDDFTPDAIGWHGLDYSVTGLGTWPLTVIVYWQSDTYPGWHRFKTLSDDSEFVWLHSETNDNVRYKVDFWTNAPYAYATWTFCKDW